MATLLRTPSLRRGGFAFCAVGISLKNTANINEYHGAEAGKTPPGAGHTVKPAHITPKKPINISRCLYRRREGVAKFKAGKVVGYILRNGNGGAFVSIDNLKAFCKLASFEGLLWGKKQYVVLVENNGETGVEKEEEIAAAGYIALSRNRKHFYLLSRQNGVECMGWASRLAQFLKGETQRCPVHQRLPSKATEVPQ
jgi:hypothetical protein